MRKSDGKAICAADCVGGGAADGNGVRRGAIGCAAVGATRPNLNKTIMCPVCPGESIDQSQNTLAVQMRGIVDDKIAMGWSDARIRGFFVERYGPSVLLDPPTEGIGLAVWIGAPLGVALALAAFALALRHMRRPTAQDGGDGSAKAQALKDDDAGDMDETDADLQPYYERIEAAMRGDGDRG